MSRLIMAALRCSLMLLVPTVTYGISAQWDLDPISGDWNTAANWTPNGIPNGPADVATFGLSNTTNVSISADTEVNGIIFAPAATSPYTITVSPVPLLTFTISGAGITNNSGTTQNFVTSVGVGRGTIIFKNSATAGNLTMFINSGGAAPSIFGGSMEFRDTSTAGEASFINNPGNAIISGGGIVLFFDSSTAANATFINKGSAIVGGFQNFAFTSFNGNSTAANATVTNGGGAANGAFGAYRSMAKDVDASEETFVAPCLLPL